MYTPRFNQVSDRAILIEAMHAYSFAILIGPLDSRANTAAHHVTHLPLVVKDEGPHGILEGHFAKPTTLAITRQPRNPRRVPRPAQLCQPLASTRKNSPSPLGTTSPFTPTARSRSSKTTAGKDALLTGLIEANEPAYAEQWSQLPDGFRRTMLAGIVGFRIPISRIEGKFKISQNRPEADRHAVRAAHSAGTLDQQP